MKEKIKEKINDKIKKTIRYWFIWIGVLTLFEIFNLVFIDNYINYWCSVVLTILILGCLLYYCTVVLDFITSVIKEHNLSNKTC